MVTSAAVPAVVGTAMVKVAWFLVSATPSSERTSPNSGFSLMTPMALAVSMEEPPPMATMQSAPDSLMALTPSWTFWMVGLGLISEYRSQATPASSRRSVTLEVTPNFTRSGSEQTKAFSRPWRLISPGISLMAPEP